MSAIEQQQSIVKESLFHFITQQIPSADLDMIDNIVLSYVISILEEASEDSCFDVEGFIEMMTAFIPDFGHIDAGKICSWIMELEADLSQSEKIKNESKENEKMTDDQLSMALAAVRDRKCVPSTKSSRSHSNSESSEASSEQRAPLLELDCYEHVNQCRALYEMFPNTCTMEIKHCVSIAGGNVELAAATLLARREGGQQLPLTLMPARGRQPPPTATDDELKSRIIARYSYVDKDAETKEHKPLAPKMEPKKMVRYLDNKIVSLKGERFTEVPEAGIDEEHLKKPKKHSP